MASHTLDPHDLMLECLENIEPLIEELLDKLMGKDAENSMTYDELAIEFNEQYTKFLKVIRLVPEHQARAAEIRRLEGFVKNRNDLIFQMSTELNNLRNYLENNIFQANQKLCSINQSEVRRFPWQDAIDLAYRISKDHSVAAPHDWKSGDNRRPYPSMGAMMPRATTAMTTQLMAAAQQQTPSKQFTSTMVGARGGRIGSNDGLPRNRPSSGNPSLTSPNMSSPLSVVGRAATGMSPMLQQKMTGMPIQQQQRMQQPQQSNEIVGGGSALHTDAKATGAVEQMTSDSSSSSSSGDEAN